MTEDLDRNQNLDLRIAEALDRGPQITVPEGFAARLASRLPQQAPARPVMPVFRYTYSRRLAMVCVALLAAALLVVAASRPSNFTVAEVIFVGEMALLTLWLARWRTA
ncbi:hypothetical protein FTW19_00495 [Terriglobus albidus]|uniref:DUF3040 domain-containing protein n=1 Tax=Terriglobus albidus TaxID=1592106 RepID=A0A5B9E991_9BACT|nr:hypothetical protein [Terriglobus albidus]QEE26616.1 hypothetical protein FTW19_00495 [Terriglobus albidus]